MTEAEFGSYLDILLASQKKPDGKERTSRVRRKKK